MSDHPDRTPGGGGAAPEPRACLPLLATSRPVFTAYARLLKEGYDVDSARFFVAGEIDAVLEGWGAVRRVGEE